MRRPKIHNRIGRSMATLPICGLLAVGLWWWPQGCYSHEYGVSLLLAVLTAYIIVETNNTCQLLRVRSRMVSSVWLFSLACIGSLHPFLPTLPAAFCLSASYYLLFRTYQQTQPVVDVFHTFLLLALGSLFFPPLALFAPFFLWYLLVFMRSLTFRGFFAALVGLILPFWFWGGWLLWQGDLGPLLSWWRELAGLWQLKLTIEPSVSLLLPVILGVWTGVAYLMNSFDDKIRTRMMFYIYVFQTVLLIALAPWLAQPHTILPLLLLNVSPLLAHYFTLRNTWLSMIVFFLALLAFCFVAVQTLFPALLALVIRNS